MTLSSRKSHSSHSQLTTIERTRWCGRCTISSNMLTPATECWPSPSSLTASFWALRDVRRWTIAGCSRPSAKHRLGHFDRKVGVWRPLTSWRQQMRDSFEVGAVAEDGLDGMAERVKLPRQLLTYEKWHPSPIQEVVSGIRPKYSRSTRSPRVSHTPFVWQLALEKKESFVVKSI